MRRPSLIGVVGVLAVLILAGACVMEQRPARENRAGDFQERIRDQRERIEQGIRSGELTRSEADILLDNLDRLRDRFSRMKADGRLTVEEQQRLDQMLDRNNQMIYNKKHNPVRRLDW